MKIVSIPKMRLDREGNLQIRKSYSKVEENYKSTIIVMDFVKILGVLRGRLEE